MTIVRMLAIGAMGLGLSVAAWGADAPTTAPANRPARGPAVPTGLGAAMKDMARLYKALKTSGTDPAKQEESLRNVQLMERDAAIAKLNLPPSVQRASGDDKAKKTEDYRADMGELMRTLLTLEDAIAARNADDVSKGLEAIKAAMDKGHQEFIPKREE